MRLYFKQRLFSWFDSYDIYNEAGDTEYVVKGEFSWGKCLRIYDKSGFEVGMIKQRILSFLPRYEIYYGENYIGCITKEFSLFTPRFNIDFNGWYVEGNFIEWDYTILGDRGEVVATIYKDVWNWTDTYVLNVTNTKDALSVLMLTLAIDAEKDSRDN